MSINGSFLSTSDYVASKISTALGTTLFLSTAALNASMFTTQGTYKPGATITIDRITGATVGYQNLDSNNTNTTVAESSITKNSYQVKLNEASYTKFNYTQVDDLFQNYTGRFSNASDALANITPAMQMQIDNIVAAPVNAIVKDMHVRTLYNTINQSAAAAQALGVAANSFTINHLETIGNQITNTEFAGNISDYIFLATPEIYKGLRKNLRESIISVPNLNGDYNEFMSYDGMAIVEIPSYFFPTYNQLDVDAGANWNAGLTGTTRVKGLILHKEALAFWNPQMDSSAVAGTGIQVTNGSFGQTMINKDGVESAIINLQFSKSADDSKAFIEVNQTVRAIYGSKVIDYTSRFIPVLGGLS